tara:strand:- start:168 stop:461 length:294 start_codon:yes stop_codon:yes gene_type:complete
MCTLNSSKSINYQNASILKKFKFHKLKILNPFLKKNYLIAINRTKYRKSVEVIAKAERGKIKPVFSHLKNLIFLLITFAINSKRINLNLLKVEGCIK